MVTKFLGIFRAARQPWAAQPFWLQASQVLGILFVYRVLQEFLDDGCRLPPEIYSTTSFLVSALGHPPFLLWVVLPGALFAATLWRGGWQELGAPRGLRWMGTAVAVGIAWTYSTYQVNLYYGQLHLLERGLLVLLSFTVAWRPAMLWPFLAVAFSITHQFDHPLPGWNWLDKGIAYEMLTLLAATVLARRWLGLSWMLFPLVAVGFMASNYFIPGLAKLRIQWLPENDLGYLAVSTWLQGWLPFVGEEAMLRWVDRLGWANQPLKLATLATELGSILLLSRPKAFAALVLGTVALHLGIVASSGIFFWKWIVLNLVLGSLVWANRNGWAAPLFGWKPTVLLSLVVAFSPLHVNPTWLMWYDTPLSEYFEFEVETAAGEQRPLSRTFFAPYDLIFAQNRFYYLSEQRHATATFSAIGSDTGLFREVLALQDSSDVAELLERRGELRSQPELRERFDRFLQLYLGTLNGGMRKHLVPHKLQAPIHISTWAGPGRYRGEEQVVAVHVYLVRVLFTGGELHRISRERIHSVAIPPRRPEGAPG